MSEQQHPEQIPMAGGKAASSKVPAFHLIPTLALEKLAERFELGVARKGDKAWNAISNNQECLVDREFLVERCSHVIYHAMKLRDMLNAGLIGPGHKAYMDSMSDNASAVAWGGCFLTCAADALEKEVPVPRNEKERDMLSTMDAEILAEFSGKLVVGNSYVTISGRLTGPMNRFAAGDDIRYFSRRFNEVYWNESGKAIRIDQGISNNDLTGYNIRESMLKKSV